MPLSDRIAPEPPGYISAIPRRREITADATEIGDGRPNYGSLRLLEILGRTEARAGAPQLSGEEPLRTAPGTAPPPSR